MVWDPTRRRGGALAGLAAGGMVLAVPGLVDAYTLTVAATALTAALLAVSAQLLTSHANLPTLGQAGFAGIGAYTASLTATHLTDDVLAQLALATITAAAVGAVIAPFITRTRALAFLLCTLAVGELAYTVAEHATSVTGGGNGLPSPPGTLFGVPLASDTQTYLYAAAVTIAVTLAVTALLRSRFGLILHATADHEPRTQANGHNTAARLRAAYILAAAIAGAAGALIVATRHFVSPADVNFDASALALLAAIIGGRSLLGTCAAATAIVVVRDLLADTLHGSAPTLLAVLFIAAALTRRHLRHRHLGSTP